MKRRKQTDKIQVPIRMQEKLGAELRKAAKHNGLSMNQEIVRRLEASFQGDAIEAILDLVAKGHGEISSQPGGGIRFRVSSQPLDDEEAKP